MAVVVVVVVAVVVVVWKRKLDNKQIGLGTDSPTCTESVAVGQVQL